MKVKEEHNETETHRDRLGLENAATSIDMTDYDECSTDRKEEPLEMLDLRRNKKKNNAELVVPEHNPMCNIFFFIY